MSASLKVLSTKTSPYDIENLIKTNNIVEVARDLGIKVNKNIVPCIRQHNHVVKNGTPSMSINVVNNTFKCWICPKVGGNVLDLVMQVKDVDEAAAAQYLAIRNDSDQKDVPTVFFTGKKTKALDTEGRELVFKQFLDGVEKEKGIDLIAFASTKGGTGKSLVANNLSVLVALIARYIGNHKENKPKNVELIDLDFGKPDQRILFNSEPKYYIEDMFYEKYKNLSWNDLRENTPLQNLSFVSPCPVRKSNSLYYLNKNEILFKLHNSDSVIKLADFGGGANKDSLDFLGSIKNTVFVLNPDRASVEAVFNLILALIYNPLKSAFKDSKEAQNIIEKFRNYQRSGMSVEKLREEFKTLDKNFSISKTVKSFYDSHFVKFKKEIGIEVTNGFYPTLDKIKQDLPMLSTKMNEILFDQNGNNNKFTFNEKSKLFKKHNLIRQAVSEFANFSDRLEQVMKATQYGFIVNRASDEDAEKSKNILMKRVEEAFSIKLNYLGNIPDEEDLRNVSNYEMPFVIANANHPVMKNFCTIADKIIGLKSGASESIIAEQKSHISSVRAYWKEKIE